MPSIFTPAPAETERKGPGFGGKPPVARRPTGGGGGGGDDEWKPQRRGPRELLNRTRAFVFCALAGDMMFFVVLVALFYARQTGTRMDAETLRQVGTLPWYGAEYALDDYLVYAFYGHKREHSGQISVFKDHLPKG